MSRAAALALAGLLLAACASPPAPVRYGGPPEGPLPPEMISSGPGGVPVVSMAAQGPFAPNAYLFACGFGEGSNMPALEPDGRVSGFSPIALIDGRLVIARAPANEVCFSSGFGPRFASIHEGIDLAPRGNDLTVYSAAPGILVEVGVARGYGNYVVIDHGGGLYSRYAHLSAFGEGIEAGVALGFGQPIGLIGATGNAMAPHLHFEILSGTYGPRRSFGLEARDPLSFPAYDLQAGAS